jgi:hypothetical protein
MDSPQKPETQSQETPRNIGAEAQLVTDVMQRLAARNELWRLARSIWQGLYGDGHVAQQVNFVVEGDPSYDCVGGSPASSNFNCTSSFICNASFECLGSYSDCGGFSRFNCSTKDAEFDCGAQIYDCQFYTCGNAGAGSASYNCVVDLDFWCGDKFTCYDSFRCEGGHIFACEDTHVCSGLFGCAATGSIDCSGDYPYSRPDNGGTDTISGDFACGAYTGNGSTFACTGSTFTCTAEDEFDCQGLTHFDCNNDFVCGDETNFECDSVFGCVESFSCEGNYSPP